MRWPLAIALLLGMWAPACLSRAQTGANCVGEGALRCAEQGSDSGLSQGTNEHRCRTANDRAENLRKRIISYPGDLRVTGENALAQAEHDRDEACSAAGAAGADSEVGNRILLEPCDLITPTEGAHALGVPAVRNVQHRRGLTSTGAPSPYVSCKYQAQSGRGIDVEVTLPTFWYSVQHMGASRGVNPSLRNRRRSVHREHDHLRPQGCKCRGCAHGIG